MQISKPTILVVAHEISPVRGSECAEGWRIACELSKDPTTNYIFLCADGPQYQSGLYQQEIERQVPLNKLGSVEFIYVRRSKFWAGLSQANSRFRHSSVGLAVIYYLCYAAWLREARKLAAALIKNRQVNGIHLLTQITIRGSGRFYDLGVPFIWGPTGGNFTLPFSFIMSLSGSLFFVELVRKLLHPFILPVRRIKKAAGNARMVFCFSDEDLKFFKKNNVSTKFLPDAGCETNSINFILRKYRSDQPLRLIWIGQIIGRKGLDILVETIASLPQSYRSKVRLSVIGSGARQSYCQDLAKRLGVAQLIEFLGQLPREELDDVRRRAHLMVHTSYREACTHVIPEAISNGLPVAAHDCCGMSIMLKDNGFLVPLKSRRESIEGFKQLFIEILDRPSLIGEKSSLTKNIIDEYSWERIAMQFRKTYAQLGK